MTVLVALVDQVANAAPITVYTIVIGALVTFATFGIREALSARREVGQVFIDATTDAEQRRVDAVAAAEMRRVEAIDAAEARHRDELAAVERRMTDDHARDMRILENRFRIDLERLDRRLRETNEALARLAGMVAPDKVADAMQIIVDAQTAQTTARPIIDALSAVGDEDTDGDPVDE